MSVTKIRHLDVAHGTCVLAVTTPDETTPATGVGVLVVPPFGIEHSGADRLLVALADRLADAGHTVVQIDPVGSGDSSDIDRDRTDAQTMVDAFTEATRAGLAFLRDCGLTWRVAIGVRFGALAMTKALEGAGVSERVDAAVLWSPVSAGRSYRRELLILGSSTSAGMKDGWSAPGGDVLSPTDLASLTDLDLKFLPPPSPRVLVVSATNNGVRPETPPSWSSTVEVATHCDTEVGAVCVEDPELGAVPDSAVSVVVEWINAAAVRDRTVAEAKRPELPDAALRSVDGPGWREFPVTLTMADGTLLFGIATRPTIEPQAALILLSTGTNPRFGPGRFHARVARRLAADGMATLRMERRGAARDPTITDAYDPIHIDDVSAILRQAPAIVGTESLVLAGTCSGAWAAWHSALRGFDGAMPREVVMINQIIFGEDSWDLTEASPAIAVRARQSLSNRQQWKAVFRGEINVARSAHRLLRYAALTTKNRISGFDGLASDLEIVRRGGVATTFLFDAEETGLVYLRMHGNGHLDRLIEAGQCRVLTVPGAGHVFSSPASVEWLVAQLRDALRRAASAANARAI